MSPANKRPAWDHIARNYRDPGGTDPVERWLPHPCNARVICVGLDANGLPEQEVEEGMHDVFVRALTAFKGGARGASGSASEMDCLRLVVSRPGAIETLRGPESEDRQKTTCDRK